MNSKDNMLLKSLLNSEPRKREKFMGGDEYEIYISQYDHWMAKAREEAFEAAEYKKLLKDARSYEDVSGIERYMQNKMKLVYLYLARADKYAGRAMQVRIAEVKKIDDQKIAAETKAA